MKKSILTLLVVLSGFLAKAQEIKYEVLYDNPVKPWWSLNFEFVQIDMGINNIDGASFNFGAFGYLEPVNGLGLDYVYRRSWLTAGGLGSKEYKPNTDLEIGGHYIFASNTRNKKTKIVLSKEYSGDTYSYNAITNTRTVSRTETVKFFQMQAKRMINSGLRAGFISKTGPFGFSEKEEDLNVGTIITGNANLTSSGFYFGLLRQYYTNVFVKVEDWGIKYNSIGRDFYVDLLFMPVNTFELAEVEPLALEDVDIPFDNLSSSPLGFRVGFSVYQTEAKKRTGKFFGTGGKLEFGIKPYQGIFFNGSWSITLVKSQKNPFAQAAENAEDVGEE